MGLTNAKGSQLPREKKKASEVEQNIHSPPLERDQAKLYRSLVMRAQFLAQDRGDLGETVKCLTRRMAQPRECDFADLKRLGRFIKSKPRVVTYYENQALPTRLDVLCDSDHAGCLETRRSTTGVVVRFGRCLIKTSSNIQSTIALSSGESEY